MNSALKLHQKLFLKIKSRRKKGPTALEKLLTPFSSDRLDKEDESDRDSSEEQKQTIKIAETHIQDSKKQMEKQWEEQKIF